MTRTHYPTHKILILGGKTGGPIIPLLAMAKYITQHRTNTEIIVCGIRNAIEHRIARDKDMRFIAFPEAKLRLLTFKNTTIKEKLINIVDTCISMLLLTHAFIQACITLLTVRPTMIISTGSFLAVPILYTNAILRLLKLSRSKVVIHQQDPQPGISNQLTARFADILSCVFERTQKTKQFASAQQIPNPFDFDTINKGYIDQLILEQSNKNPDLIKFITKKNKPLLLVFGGGSGSHIINQWVITNESKLSAQYNILHITGAGKNEVSKPHSESYYSLEYLIDEMKIALFNADLVISRCGMGTITELQNLKKPAFLIPIAESHQEINAQEVNTMFYILEQKDVDQWYTTIQTNYPKWFVGKINDDIATNNQAHLEQYYQGIIKILR